MSTFVVGAFEHPVRHAPDISTSQLHAEVAAGALRDAGLSFADVDAYYTAGAPGLGPINMVEYMGLTPRIVDSTETGGSAYMLHVGHAMRAIATGQCRVALITLAGRPRSAGMRTVTDRFDGPEEDFERPYRAQVLNLYAMVAARHMYEHGTTSEQLAWIKVAASHHAQHNPNAFLKKVVTVEDVVSSPLVSDPLHRLDCCVVTDGGGALVLACEEVARSLSRPLVRVMGAGEAVGYSRGGYADITTTGALRSGAAAFAEAGVTPADIKMACIYDSFTISVLVALEDLGFCEKGGGGRFVADGNLISGVGRMPFNTDGGGLCNNHPYNRGGMTKLIEAVRQLRGEAHPAVQVPNCDLALAHGTGGWLGARHVSGTVIMGAA